MEQNGYYSTFFFVNWDGFSLIQEPTVEANKNFIGIVEGEQRTADQSTSNLRLNEIGVPKLFHPCSCSICQGISDPQCTTAPYTFLLPSARPAAAEDISKAFDFNQAALATSSSCPTRLNEFCQAKEITAEVSNASKIPH